MCLCKLHLHAQWSVNSLLQWTRKVGVNINANNFRTFLGILMVDCPSEQHTHISWECTPNKKSVCDHVTKNWSELKQRLQDVDDQTTTVQLKEFKVQLCYDANGQVLLNKDNKEVKKLLPLEHQVTLEYIHGFIEDIMPNVIYHRNMLRLYRNVKSIFLEFFSCVYMDVDFSENLTIGIKWEPQSLHWSKKQVTVHSGITKTSDGVKVYHPYVSDTLVHDQAFVDIAMREMLSTTDLDEATCILVESDNCSGQYKSAEHFHDLQKISNDTNLKLIRLYGIEGHGKGEVDHVGGIAKVYARDQITRGVIFTNAAGIATSLIKKFGANMKPAYHIKEVEVEELEELRCKRRKKVFKTVDGSSTFHVLVFKPKESFFLASPRLCICDECKHDYGSCSLFSQHELNVQELRDIPLRSDDPPPAEIVGEEAVDDFILPDSFAAIAADDPTETLWFIQVIDVNLSSTKNEVDGYKNVIPPGTMYVSGYFLERDTVGKKSVSYKIDKSRVTYVYKESIVYPYVNFVAKDGHVVLHNEDYTDILMWVEKKGLIHV
eukprot:gene19611-21542_t